VACRSRAQPRDQIAKAGSSNAVATRRLAGSSIASSSWPRRRFWTKACPANTTVALRSCLSPRIGRSRAFGRPWSHSMRLLGYWSVRCQVAGGRSSSTSGYAAARSVVTSRRDPRRADGPLGEPAGSRRVPPLRDEYVDDVPELVDRTVDIAPPAGDLHLGLVDLPAVIDSVAAGPGGLGEQRGEALDPAVDGGVVDVKCRGRRGAPRRRGTTARGAGTSAPRGRSPRTGSRSQRRQMVRGRAEAARARGPSLPPRASHTAGATVQLSC
jgi:hypothetical protein